MRPASARTSRSASPAASACGPSSGEFSRSGADPGWASIVAWIIGAHHLWRRRDELSEGWDPFLWNASTVLTLLVGVVTMAVAVFAFNIVVTVFFLEPPVYSSDAATWPGFVDHVRLAWLATGFATVAGAVGSGLDSDAAVEAAAYDSEQRQEAARTETASSSR